ncbi:MAG TPA: hypothetical protein VE990_19270, partial [Acidimicrobiales bacterium]|nr:hypothetical protein [Acidimicrobiales bacterium]
AAAELAEVPRLGQAERDILTLAVCAHDVVYRAAPGTDERASAEWARMRLTAAGLDRAPVERVAAAVLATAGHRPTGDPVVDCLLDADLAILAAPPPAYDRYVEDVRAEYGALDDRSWAQGRRRLLTTLRDRRPLFLTEPGRRRWEETARGNLERELSLIG